MTNLTEIATQNFGELCDWMKTAASSATEIAQRETPLFINEYIEWVFWSNLYYCLLPLILFLLFGFIAMRCFSKSEWYACGDAGNGHAVVTIIFGIISIVCAAFFIGNMIANAPDIIKARVAPRVLVVEKIADIIK